ncbi:MAG: hypothetical protein IJE72_04695 [Clostridia bacterium]|nr:hypothetical protein [Clostridia bacterium]
MKNKKPTIYTIATAHLDTSWLWTFEQTIDEYLPDTLKKNFELLEKHPEYKFNFEGSYRYELIREYYPEEYEKLKKHIAEGRWNPCGACYENGDVNIPSPEALIRNILYGNGFFRKEFGVESNDIFLPDCFGFGKALPSIAAHSGLTGFSTGKLFWGSSVQIPFDYGKWIGTDGNGIWASLMPFSYTTAFGKMSKARRILEKLENSKKNNLPEFTFAYHGIGDRGGSPHKSSVKNVVNAQRNNDNSETEFYSATTKEFFDILEAMPEETKKSMPVYDGEFLLTAHGAGSYTSRTVTKRWNRRCELLADAAERFSSAAFINGLSEYPQYGIDSAWKKVIAHQFHDDITGTSFEKCYKRTHNDYVQAMNTFSAEFTAACKSVSEQLDTSFAEGIPVVVSNPLQTSTTRKEAVRVTVNSDSDYFRVFDKNNEEVPSQTRIFGDNRREIVFIADAPSCGLAVYDLRKSSEKSLLSTELKITQKSIENKNLAVKIDENGDVCSIFDKKLGKELLKRPIRFAVFNNTHSFDWPAWEIKYEDICEKPYMYAGNPEIKIKDSGAAVCSLEITKIAGKSVFTQIVSLDCESSYVSVYNETDWREEASLLKAEFTFTAENENANYDIGIGSIKRGTNTEKLYEVPAQKWADITDESGDYGVSVFSDSRVGWDKPDGSTLRLTVVHTPMANYRHECSQHVMDMGLNRYSFAVAGHSGNPETVTALADAFCQPMHTFITEKHPGTLGKDYSFVKLNNDAVRITAVKKAQHSDEIILRVAECSGVDQSGVEVEFSELISEAYEIRGDEAVIGKAEVTDGKLRFDIGHNSIRSFAMIFKKEKKTVDCGDAVVLNYNAIGITDDANRHKSTLIKGVSIPREILPEKLLFAGVEYSFSAEEKNCIVCDGGEIEVGEGYESVHLLVASFNGDKKITFECGNKIAEVTVPDCFEALGQWDFMMLGETGYIKSVPQAIALSHTHAKKRNMTAKQFYIFDAEIPLEGGTKIKLPVDGEIVIFAATAVKKKSVFSKGNIQFDTLEKREFDYKFSDYAVKHMNRNIVEKILDKFIDRTYSISVKIGDFHNKYAFDELYYILRSLCDRISYKKTVEKLVKERENHEKHI